MLPKLQEAKYLSDYRVWLKFADGIEGEIDLEKELWGEMFEPLKDKNYFSQFLLMANLKLLYGQMGRILRRSFYINSYALTTRSSRRQKAARLSATLCG